MTTRMLTMAEVADLLHIHVGSVRRIIARGDLPVERYGRTVRIDPVALQHYRASVADATRAVPNAPERAPLQQKRNMKPAREGKRVIRGGHLRSL